MRKVTLIKEVESRKFPSGGIGRVGLYKCYCGNEFKCLMTAITTGKTKSCGCLHKEGLIKRNTRHGQSRNPVYIAWANMMKRCNNPSCPKYEHYGGRGISVCDRWQTFENFLSDMGESYVSGYTLERIRVNEGYSLGNCIWADFHTQSRNKRTNIMITYNGETKCLKDWSMLLFGSASALGKRIRRGYSIEDAMTKPLINKQIRK